MRGVHAVPSISATTRLGSSPHARGPHYNVEISADNTRIIPACAGSTERIHRYGIGLEDHPRMRGVHATNKEILLQAEGSSPHARGPQMSRQKDKLHVRIIPACAGSTITMRDPHTNEEDHPRMRGVHHFSLLLNHAVLGSSPHARGPLPFFFQFRRGPGIIPACAGSTGGQDGEKQRYRDHPRMRGVHSLVYRLAYSSIGSSPHARGPPHKGVRVIAFKGIIPACAGSTRPMTRSSRRGQDHPRMRGVHLRPRPTWSCWPGSSPHARGPRSWQPAPWLRHRIIPACAGSTMVTEPMVMYGRDHPRMRGVHFSAPVCRTWPRGSSPHARGPQCKIIEMQSELRIIPACAGSTASAPMR